jgi:hypothetical protein
MRIPEAMMGLNPNRLTMDVWKGHVKKTLAVLMPPDQEI